MPSSSLLHLIVNEALKTSQMGTSFASASLNWKGKKWVYPRPFHYISDHWREQTLNTQGPFFKTQSKKGGFPAHPASGRTTLLRAIPASYWSGVPDFVPRLWKHYAVVGLEATHLWRAAAVWAPTLKLFFLWIGWWQDKKKFIFLHQNSESSAGENVKQGINQNNKRTCEELVRKEMKA